MNKKQLTVAEIEKKDKEKTSQFFKKLRLEARLISEGETKAPDFEIYQNNNLFGYCELKSVMEDDWMDGGRPDPTYNKIQNKIHEAVKQLKTINPAHTVPNIILIINHEEHCGSPDLHTVLTGKFLSTKGEIDFDHRYQVGLVKKGDLSQVDAIVWIDDKTDMPHFYFLEEGRFKQQFVMLPISQEALRTLRDK